MNRRLPLLASPSPCPARVLPHRGGIAGIATLVMLGLLMPIFGGEAPLPQDAATVALEQLRAANVARAELAREETAWAGERARLAAALTATRAEVARLERDASVAESQRDQARTTLAAIGNTSDLDIVRQRLGDAAVTLRQALANLAATVPPGVVTLPASDLAGDAAFDAAVRALDAAERSAGTLGVEVVSGTRAGQTEAVKLLRVAGAAAWWVSLDGTAAGSARMSAGKLQLDAASDERTRLAITAALAQAEGRAHPTVLLLPTPARAEGQP